MNYKTILIKLLIIVLLTFNVNAEESPFPVGMVAAFSTDTIPGGFLECDGRTLLIAEYPELFAVIGTSYGTETAADFKLPDYRGQFLRGWNHGATSDPDAATRTDRGDGVLGDVVGSKQADELKSHFHNLLSTGGPLTNSKGTGPQVQGRIGYISSATSAYKAILTTDEGGSESRPKNISVIWCIRSVPSTGGGSPVFAGTNVFLGDEAGLNNVAGTGNIFIGNKSGRDEVGSNKLYIANSETTVPLIYGEFNTNKVQVNGELRATGGVRTTEVNVQLQTAWPDYVFEGNYILPTLIEVEKFIESNKRLPGIPSAKEIKANGLPMSILMTKQMEKIEELTLYMIELKKQNEALEVENNQLKREILPSILKRLKTLESK